YPDEVFFCQAEDGIRDGHVTGVQTCALPISSRHGVARLECFSKTTFESSDAMPRCGERWETASGCPRSASRSRSRWPPRCARSKIGRAACRERVLMWVGALLVDRKRLVMVRR